jgi:hypothetical protein
MPCWELSGHHRRQAADPAPDLAQAPACGAADSVHAPAPPCDPGCRLPPAAGGSALEIQASSNPRRRPLRPQARRRRRTDAIGHDTGRRLFVDRTHLAGPTFSLPEKRPPSCRSTGTARMTCT